MAYQMSVDGMEEISEMLEKMAEFSIITLFITLADIFMQMEMLILMMVLY